MTALKLSDAGEAASVWITVLTTEHYNLQTQRAATITEANGRAAIFMGTVSAGLVALGFSGQGGGRSAGVVAFAAIVLSALTFLGFVTFVRAVQTSIDDWTYAAGIETLRDTYAQLVPELAAVLAVARVRDAYLAGARRGRFQMLLTVSGSLAVTTSTLASGAVGMVLYGATGGLPTAIAIGAVVGVTAVTCLLRYQSHLWRVAVGPL